MTHFLKAVLLTGAACLLAACGGGGGGAGGLNSTPTPVPTPTPTPTPTPSTALNIIENAPTGDFVVAGATFSGTYMDPDPMATLSVSSDEQPQFRYDSASNTYEVMLPGSAWDELVSTDMSEPDWGRRLAPAGSQNGNSIYLNYDRNLGESDAYPASTIGYYYAGGGETERSGWIAFGVPTPIAALPVSGSATFSGEIFGTADVFEDDGWGGFYPAFIGGTVTLSFDFSQASLAGSMSPILYGKSLGTFLFADAIYSAGQYSGHFDTNVAGVNSFSGILTGSSAQELIGAWALPFHYSVDDKDHQAAGAWIAKQ